MRIESEYDRQERQARTAVWAGLGLLLLTLGFAFLVRYRPDLASLVVPVARPSLVQGESAGLAPTTRETAFGSLAHRPDSDSGSDTSRPAPAPDTGFPPALAVPQDTAGHAGSPDQRSVITDVVLLPCSTPNPRPDGTLLIPPHNPNHRTVVGLPQKAGSPPRGFVVPPHDPGRENQVPIEIIPMDSILEHTLRVPPHDPTEYNLVRPDPRACLADSVPGRPRP